MSRWLVTAALLLFAPHAAGEADAPLPELAAHDLTTGEFTQHRHVSGLQQPLVSHGRFVYTAERGVLWQVTEPVASTVIITPDGLFQEGERVGGGNPVAVMRPVFRALFGGEIEPLSDYFEIDRLPADNGWRLRLIPRGDALTAVLQQITIAGDRYPSELVIEDRDGGRTELQLRSIDHPGALAGQARREFERNLP